MKVNVSETIKDLDGNPIQDDISNGGNKYLTLAKVISTALLNPIQPEKQTEDDKVQSFYISHDVYEASKKGESVDLTEEQIQLIKKQIGKKFMPLIVGRTYQLLEQDQNE